MIVLKKLEVNNNQTIKQKKLTKWLKFILNPNETEDIDMSEDEDIKAAKEILKQISQDEREREKARLRDKYVREMNSSRNEGYFEGEKNEKIKIAQNMLKEGSNIEFIMKCTGLTKEEIKKLSITN
jgi:predicted transposase/invertase (TIGR01784 family)